MYSAQKKWLLFSFFNLSLVALLGVTLRYKIAFSLPFIDQQKLLHGHSHFAFTGWVTQALMVLLVGYLSERSGRDHFSKYKWILIFNAVTAYGMLFSFPVQGYGPVSILFSTLSIFASYYFAIYYWRDLGRLKVQHTSDRWFKVALIGNVISSAGPFSLAYMMALQHMNQAWYLASIYFYLHFQYNVWFFFSCMGLLTCKLQQFGLPDRHLKSVFYGFAVAAFPAYLLSVLWLHIPAWLYAVALFGVSSQLYAWTLLLIYLYKHIKVFRRNLPALSRTVFTLAGLAVTVKLLLQTVSIIPSVSKLAFGFRPIVIGYLHLILLGMISLFIIGFAYTYDMLQKTRPVKTGISIFVAGIFINEVLLMSQGVSDLLYISIDHINFFLLAAAVILFAGAVLIVSGLFFGKDDLSHKKESGMDGILKKNNMDNNIHQSIASMVLKNYQIVPVLEKYGIDFCCKGKKTLTDACNEKGIALSNLLSEIDSVQVPENSRVMPFAEMSQSQLVNHIIVNHHYYVRKSMPLIMAHLEKIAFKHGAHYTYMIQVRDLFKEIQKEMDLHMQKEELVLFPRIIEMEKAEKGEQLYAFHENYIKEPISMMESEHEHAGGKMFEIRRLTNGYQSPPDACTTFQVCLSELKEFEGDLHQHVHLENNILFPRALQGALSL